MESDQKFFAKRAYQERSAAEKAMSRQARAAHLELAKGYEKLSVALEEAHRPTLDAKTG